MKQKAWIGKKFGTLTVIKLDKNKSKKHRPAFILKCDCGKKVSLWQNLLPTRPEKWGCSYTCKLRNVKRKTDNKAEIRKLYNIYKRGAKKRKLAWNLSYKSFVKLIFDNCFYCGQKNTSRISDFRKHKNATPTNYCLDYTGIDRLNNAYGYSNKNCVTSCKTCNWAKGKKSLQEFESWLNRIVKFRSN